MRIDAHVHGCHAERDASGKLDTAAVSKLCFGTDGQSLMPGEYGTPDVASFYDKLFDALKVPAELQEKVNRGNILKLVEE